MLNHCRHYLGLYPDSRPSCAKGRDVRAWAKRCNDGNDFGIAKHIPCPKQREGGTHWFSCPDLDRKTVEEVERDRAEFKKKADKVLSRLGQVMELKAKMIKRNFAVAKANCPWCGAKNKLILHCNIKGNKHLHVKCKTCGEGFIE